MERVWLSIHSSNNAPDVAKKKGVILHGVEGKDKRNSQMVEAAGEHSGKEVNAILFVLDPGAV